MTRPVPLHRPERLDNIRLGIVAAALATAFVWLPRPLASLLTGRSYGDEQRLTDEVSAAFVDYWHTGQRSLTPALSHLVDYWRWFHVVKAVTAIGLLVVLVLLATRLWKTYANTDPRAHGWSAATGGVFVTALSVFAFALTMANVQGTLAPFASLMSLLPINSASDQLRAMIAQVKHDLAHYPSGSPGSLVMVSDFASYHVVVAVISWFVAAVLTVLMVASWRRYVRTAKTERRARRLFCSLGIASLVVTGLIVVLALANTSAALDSPTAVLNFYRGTF